ncbi:MAG: hypothetical protein QG673_1637 [Pseudomonadota bacterium]|nr:hypothetical protein [Pseudomonadota bacterium]
MIEPMLLEFEVSSTEYRGKYCGNNDLLQFSAEKYYNLCNYMAGKGRCLLNKESLDELFKIYMENKRWLKKNQLVQ